MHMLFIVDALMQVALKEQAGEDERRAIIKVLVDLLLDMGLVYVLDVVISYHSK